MLTHTLTMKEALAILKTSAHQQTIDNRRCFVVPWETFQQLVDFFPGAGETDVRISACGYNNFQIALTVNDENVYYVASKSGPILDELWKKEENK